MAPVVSVIVCTRSRAHSLERCLTSIRDDPSTTPAEVIVVDNASIDHTAAVIRKAMTETSRSLLTARTEVRGHARARNVGIDRAHGSILLFTDDDVQVEPGWIDAMAAPFADPEIGAVGGRIIPTYLCDRPVWLTDDSIFLPVTLPDYGETPFDFDPTRLPIGANMAIRRSILPPDPFHPDLGHTGRLAIGFDEFFLMAEIIERHRVVYAPGATVRHMLDEDRLTVQAAERILFHIGIGFARYRRLSGDPQRSVARRAVKWGRAWWRLRRARGDQVVRMRAWWEAGETTEWLLGSRTPRLALWCARNLAGR
jgi:glycosyltransferase involved in cell wall biosynthesis